MIITRERATRERECVCRLSRMGVSESDLSGVPHSAIYPRESPSHVRSIKVCDDKHSAEFSGSDTPKSYYASEQIMMLASMLNKCLLATDAVG